MYQTKEESLAHLRTLADELEADTEGDVCVAIVAANSKTGDVKMWGMNIDDEEMCELLVQAAEVVFDTSAQQTADRVLN